MGSLTSPLRRCKLVTENTIPSAIPLQGIGKARKNAIVDSLDYQSSTIRYPLLNRVARLSDTRYSAQGQKGNGDLQAAREMEICKQQIEIEMRHLPAVAH